MQRKILTCIVVTLFIISGIYIFHLANTISDVRELQRQRGIDFEADFRNPV